MGLASVRTKDTKDCKHAIICGLQVWLLYAGLCVYLQVWLLYAELCVCLRMCLHVYVHV